MENPTQSTSLALLNIFSIFNKSLEKTKTNNVIVRLSILSDLPNLSVLQATKDRNQ